MPNTHYLLFLWITLSAAVAAYDWSTNPGTGTSADPYQISTVEQFSAIGSDAILLTMHFALTSDINLSGLPFTIPPIAPDTDVVTPGFQGTPFTGTFDGRRHAISNLTITPSSGRENIALFGKLDKAAVFDLNLTDVSIQAPQSNYVAAMASQTLSATITRCHVSGSVTGKSNIGGLIANLNSGQLLDNSFSGTISGFAGSSGIGGLVGAGNSCTIRRSTAEGSITVGSTSYHIGGLVGYINGVNVYACMADMQIACGENSSQIGGLIGTFDFFSYIKNCYSSGNIYAPGLSDSLGGLVGYIAVAIVDVKNSYSVCSVMGGTGNTIGGLIGSAEELVPINCYFLAQAEGGGPDNGIGTVLTAVQMKQKNSFVGFDFLGQSSDGINDSWRLCNDGARYPALSWESSIYGDFSCPNGTSMDDLLAMAAHWLNSSDEQGARSEACDADGDGKINLADGAILSRNWLTINTDFDFGDVLNLAAHWLSNSATWEQGDYTGDGKVSLADWAFLSANYQAY